jgi:hypothetical protein
VRMLISSHGGFEGMTGVLWAIYVYIHMQIIDTMEFRGFVLMYCVNYRYASCESLLSNAISLWLCNNPLSRCDLRTNVHHLLRRIPILRAPNKSYTDRKMSKSSRDLG